MVLGSMKKGGGWPQAYGDTIAYRYIGHLFNELQKGSKAPLKGFWVVIRRTFRAD